MKRTPEEKKQRIAVLLGDLEDNAKDIFWLSDMVGATVGMAQQHYKCELTKAQKTADKIKSELTSLRAAH